MFELEHPPPRLLVRALTTADTMQRLMDDPDLMAAVEAAVHGGLEFEGELFEPGGLSRASGPVPGSYRRARFVVRLATGGRLPGRRSGRRGRRNVDGDTSYLPGLDATVQRRPCAPTEPVGSPVTMAAARSANGAGDDGGYLTAGAPRVVPDPGVTRRSSARTPAPRRSVHARSG
jgi:hypothetical protein